MAEVKKLYKSRKEDLIDGVCAGTADYFNIDVTLVRIIWAASIFFRGFGLLAYIAAMIIFPVNPDHQRADDSNKNKRYGIIGGIVLITAGFFMMVSHFQWYRPFVLPGFPYFYPFSHRFWPVMLILAGVVYLIYAVSRNTQDTSRSVSHPSSPPEHTAAGEGGKKKLMRDKKNKVFAGVCSGIALYLDTDRTLIRIGFLVIALISQLFPMIVLYVILMITLPEAETTDNE